MINEGMNIDESNKLAEQIMAEGENAEAAFVEEERDEGRDEEDDEDEM